MHIASQLRRKDYRLLAAILLGCALLSAGSPNKQWVSTKSHNNGPTVNDSYWLSLNRAHAKCGQFIKVVPYESEAKFANLYFTCMKENRVVESQGELSEYERTLAGIVQGHYLNSWKELTWGEIAYQKLGIKRFSPTNISITLDQFKNDDGLKDHGLLQQKCEEMGLKKTSFVEMLILADHSRKYAPSYECTEKAETFFRYLHRHCWRSLGLCGASRLIYPSSIFLNKENIKIDQSRVGRKSK